VLELSSDGSVVTSDDPPMVLGTLAPDFLEQVSPSLLLKNSRLLQYYEKIPQFICYKFQFFS